MNDLTQENHAIIAQAVDVLQKLALDEVAKIHCSRDPLLSILAQRIAAPYIAGQTITDAVERVGTILERGHAASAEFMGESCRDEAFAQHETAVFLDLIKALDTRQFPCSISLDLSHIGAVINPTIGLRNARRIALATAASGREMMISMEGSDRVDTILDIYRKLHEDKTENLSHVGITIQARLHRTEKDFDMLLKYPGRIRLVKGAFFESQKIAYERDSQQLKNAYHRYAQHLIVSGHKCSIATHDTKLQEELCAFINKQNLNTMPFEFESLIGLGGNQLDSLQQRGYPTREYAVYGKEYFLYVLNRIAENPIRLFQAVIDAARGQSF
jgi:proline dehydrogenase